MRRWIRVVTATMLACAGTIAAGGQPANDGSERPTPDSRQAVQTQQDRIAAIENGLRPPLAARGEPGPLWTLRERMAHHKVPAVSIAVSIDGKLAWAKAYGILEAGSAEPVDADTLFQAASLSKPVAALAALTLVDRGQIDLDAPVNAYLTSWQIPENAFTRAEKVTLRHLLSHRAGTTIHGFEGYGVDQIHPTSTQILTGEAPANTSPVVIDKTPGESRRYSGGGFQVAQLLIEDVAATPFAYYVQANVFEPAGLSRSNYEFVQRHSNVASGHVGSKSKPIPAPGYYAYPERAAAGLWTTPSEMVRLGARVAAARSVGGGIISQDLARQLVPDRADEPGLGFGLNDPGDGIVFVHNGHNPGYSARWFTYGDGRASVAIMTNADTGGKLIREVASAIGYVYGWKQDAFEEREIVDLPEAWQEQLVGGYAFDAASGQPVASISLEDGRLWIEGELAERSRFYPTSREHFFIPGGLNFTIETDGDGNATGLNVEGEFVLSKLPGG